MNSAKFPSCGALSAASSSFFSRERPVPETRETPRNVTSLPRPVSLNNIVDLDESSFALSFGFDVTFHDIRLGGVARRGINSPVEDICLMNYDELSGEQKLRLMRTILSHYCMGTNIYESSGDAKTLKKCHEVWLFAGSNGLLNELDAEIFERTGSNGAIDHFYSNASAFGEMSRGEQRSADFSLWDDVFCNP
jgi:hypothetical protein